MPPHIRRTLLALPLLALCLHFPACKSCNCPPPTSATLPSPRAPDLAPPQPTNPTIHLLVNKSTTLKLETPITRLAITDPQIAGVQITGPSEFLILGKSPGQTDLTISFRGTTTRQSYIILVDPQPK